jgi:predicted enzyme involved in methoxymalonyl-ACP biosynthesis
METFYPGCEASAELSAKAVFVDLDETFLEGTVVNMTDEELEAAEIKYRTLSLIMSAVSRGIPVIMVTRNNHAMIERFFRAKPYLRGLFKEEIACPIGPKSEPIKAYMGKNGISPEEAIFLDDTSGELDDVRKNVEGILAAHPDTADRISLDGETDTLESRRRLRISLPA